MNKPDITLREARPNIEEGRLFAVYLDQAAEGFFQLMLGRNFQHIIARAFVKPNNDLSYQNVSFAEHQDRVVGMTSSYSGRQQRVFDKQALYRAAGPWHLRMRMVLAVLAPMVKALDTIPESDYYLQAIAVDNALRGQGLGSILLEAVEARANGNDCDRLALDVSAGNEGARRLYEQRGFTIDSQWPRKLRIPGLKFYRMSKALAEHPDV